MIGLYCLSKQQEGISGILLRLSPICFNDHGDSETTLTWVTFTSAVVLPSLRPTEREVKSPSPTPAAAAPATQVKFHPENNGLLNKSSSLVRVFPPHFLCRPFPLPVLPCEFPSLSVSLSVFLSNRSSYSLCYPVCSPLSHSLSLSFSLTGRV